MRNIQITGMFTLCLLVSGAAAQSEEPAFVTTLNAMEELVSNAIHGPVEDGASSDIAAMLPDLKAATKDVQMIELPSDYADVAADFDQARVALKESMKQFGKAVDASDSVGILMGIIKVHEATSRLDAAQRGICYEAVALHDVIAPIQHRALPDENWNAIRAALPDLKARIDALADAKMPEKHADKADQLAEQARQLEAAWQELSRACEKDDSEAIADAFANVHDHFHGCMELFW
jgi:hypothetical protein